MKNVPNTKEPLPKEITENGIHYTLHGDYYLPDLALPPQDNRPINHWGRMLNDYMMLHHPGPYDQMMLNGTLHTLLADISEQADERRAVIIQQMQKVEQVDEALKARDQMAWVGRMNNIAARADEIIRAELIYTWKEILDV